MQKNARLVAVVTLLALIIVAGSLAIYYSAGSKTFTSALANSSSSSQVEVTTTTYGTEIASSTSSATVPDTSTTSVDSSRSSSSLSTTLTASSSSSTTARVSHVITLLMENEEYGNVIGNASAPYQNQLASRYALAGQYLAVAHPSLPNYLALIAGSTFGVSSDCLPAQCSLAAGTTTIASLLDSHGLSWKDYSESMPSVCSQSNSGDGLYFPKHNPFVYFAAITGNNGSGSTSAYCNSHVIPLDQFWADLQAGRLPNYSFIAPNICNDAHSCPLATGDRWLSTFVPKVMESSSFSSTALFIVYDEGSPNDATGGGGKVACILVSPFAKPGYVSHVAYSHYSLLATVEAIFKLGDLGRTDGSVAPLSDLFRSQI